MPRSSKKSTAKAETAVKKDIVAETTAEAVVEAAPAEVKKPAAKKTAAKKPAAKKTAVESKVVIQANGSEATAEDLVNKAIAAADVKTVKKVDVYVRPEINKVYYVINGDVLGEFDLF